MSVVENCSPDTAKSKKLKKCASLCADTETLDQEYKKVQRGRSADQLRKIKPEVQINRNLSLEEVDFEDDDILFPFDSSKRLSNQVETLLEENGQLRKSLVEAEARLRGVVTKCPPGMSSHGRASDLAASKIVELSKRVRELTADLEVARMRCRTFELSSLTTSPSDSPQPPPTEAEPETKSQESEIKELTDKLSSANLKVCEYRNQCQQLKHELKLAHKALVSEIGEGVTVANVVSSGGSWRGRAQLIQTLQQRLSELSEKTSNPELAEKEAKRALSAARLLEKELRAEHDRVVVGMRDQLEEKQRKLEAARCRTRVLENNLTELKAKLSTLLDKTSHDDQLIAALTTQLGTNNTRNQDHTLANRLEQQNKLLEQQLSEERSKFSHMQSVLLEREQTLAAVEQKLSEFQNSVEKDTLEKSRSGSTEPNHSNTTLETVGAAAEAERVRLLELLAVTNKRLEQERQLNTQTQDILRRERHKAARLETKLARQELERVNVRNGYHNTSPHKVSETLTEELKCKIELLEEEVLYLQTRVTNLDQEKQEDLRSYTSMLEHSRHAFLDTIKSLTSTTIYPI